MSIELHLTITADTVLEALDQLGAIGVRAAVELGDGPQRANTSEPAEPELPLPEPAKGNGEAPKRTRKAKAEPDAAPAGPDRAEIIKGLTDLYMAGDPKVRSQITTFRDGYPPLTMVKILLPQQWHTLSDPGAEEAVRDRLSFRRFCGLPLAAETPDHASIWRFRQTIDKLGLSAALLAETNRQLDALGLIVKRGTLVDATLIEAAVKRPAYGDKGVNPRDPDARVTMKRKTVHFGYKAHLAVDEGSGLVRQAEMTSANVHDFRLAEALIQGDEQGYFADKAYSSQAFRERLEGRGLVDGVARRGRPHHPLEDWQRLLNSWSSSIRCGVERAHATMKQWYGMSRVRYRGLARNACHLRFVVTAMNMKPALVLMEQN